MTKMKEKGWKKIYHEKHNHKKAGVTILTSNKIDIKTRSITKIKRNFSSQWRVNTPWRQNTH